MTQLFALVLLICSSDSVCEYGVLEIYPSQTECESAKFEQRLLSAECNEVDHIIHAE